MGIKEQTNRNRRNNRQTKRAWLIVCEGRNKTETNYLNHFNKWDGAVRLIVRSSEDTDPKNMVERAKNIAESLGVGKNTGDRIICLMDLDIDSNKAQLIQSLRAKHRKIEIFLSNPCFEIWFLLHFTSHPVRENSSHSVKKQLERYVPKYTESMDILQKCPEVQSNYETAINNAVGLRNEHKRNNVSIPSADANPYTEIDLLMQDIISENGAPQINCD